MKELLARGLNWVVL